MDEMAPTQQDVQTDDWGTIGHVQTLVLMMVTVLGIYLCYKMALPFLAVVAWALTLAVLFTPLQNWLEAKFKRTGLAALISIFLIGLIVVIPALFVGQQLVIQAVKGSQIVEQKINSGEWRRSRRGCDPASALPATRPPAGPECVGTVCALPSAR